MGLTLWIDQNTFATALLEKVFKQKNIPFYTLSQVDDFLYLVEDLKPRLVVLDGPTAVSNLEAFTRQYQSVTFDDLPIVLIDGDDKLDFIKNVVGEIRRPFDPFKIPELLKSFNYLS